MKVLREKIFITVTLVTLLFSACGSNSSKSIYQTSDKSSNSTSTPTPLISVTYKENDVDINATEIPIPDLLPVYLMYNGSIYVYDDNIIDAEHFPEMNDKNQIGAILSTKNEVPKEEFAATFAYIGAKLYSISEDHIAVYLDKSVNGTELIDVNPHVLVLKKQ